MIEGEPADLRTDRARVAVVLSAGGLRGAAHVGVLRQLVRHNVPIHAIVGVSAGAIVAAYYAAVGLTLDELIADAQRFRGRHLLTYSANVQAGHRFERRLRRWCGVIPDRLQQLEAARFERLHHGIVRLGIVCYDLHARQPRYFSTDEAATLHEVVRASASIPVLFPAIRAICDGADCLLTDGGIADPVPIAFAKGAVIGATHVIVSDCRWIGSTPAHDSNVVWIRPRMASTGTLWSPRRGLLAAVANGEAAVSSQHLEHIAEWLRDDRGDARLAEPSVANRAPVICGPSAHEAALPAPAARV